MQQSRSMAWPLGGAFTSSSSGSSSSPALRFAHTCPLFGCSAAQELDPEDDLNYDLVATWSQCSIGPLAAAAFSSTSALPPPPQQQQQQCSPGLLSSFVPTSATGACSPAPLVLMPGLGPLVSPVAADSDTYPALLQGQAVLATLRTTQVAAAGGCPAQVGAAQA
jgi:hypothetical protein